MLIPYNTCFTIAVKSGVPALGLLCTIALQYFLFDEKNISILFECFGAAIVVTACGSALGWTVSKQVHGFFEGVGYAIVEHWLLLYGGVYWLLVIIPVEYFYVFHREVVLAKWGTLGVFAAVILAWELDEHTRMYVVLFGSALEALVLERKRVYDGLLAVKQTMGTLYFVLVGGLLVSYFLLRNSGSL